MAKEEGRVAIVFRFDEALHEQLTAAAKLSLRSVNNEILYRVKASFVQKQEGASATRAV